MDSPNSWNEIHRIINKALDYKSSPEDQAANVFTALVNAKAIKDNGDRGSSALCTIAGMVKRHKELLDQHFCGLSCPAMIYNELAKNGLLTD